MKPLKKIVDGHDGQLLIAESNREIPFEIKRVYFIDQLAIGSLRGFHAHKELTQVIVCLRGSFDLELYNGTRNSIVNMKSGDHELILPMVWHSMKNFSNECLIAVFASDYYKESDYIRNFHDFKKAVG